MINETVQNPETIIKILVGNKLDLDSNRVISF